MRIFFSILLISLCGYLSAAKYTIIETFGTVKLCHNNRILYNGDVLTSLNRVCLVDKGDTTAMVVLIEEISKINYVYKPDEGIEGKRKNILIPLSDDGSSFHITPPQNATAEIEYLKSVFSGPKKVILGNQFSIRINHIPFNRRLERFMVEYDYRGQKIRKSLYPKERVLVFSKSQIFNVNGTQVNPQEIREVSMYYQYGEYTKLGTFKAVFLDPNMLRQEINRFLQVRANTLHRGNRMKIENRVMHLFSLTHNLPDTAKNRKWVSNYLSKKLIESMQKRGKKRK